MSFHINRFLDKVRAAESRQQRDVILTINEARDLQADITRLLLTLNDATQTKQTTSSTVPSSIEINGGGF